MMGPGQKILTLVGSGQYFVARVGSAIFGLGLGTLVKKIELFSAEKDLICVSDAEFCRITTVRFFLQKKSMVNKHIVILNIGNHVSDFNFWKTIF